MSNTKKKYYTYSEYANLKGVKTSYISQIKHRLIKFDGHNSLIIDCVDNDKQFPNRLNDPKIQNEQQEKHDLTKVYETMSIAINKLNKIIKK